MKEFRPDLRGNRVMQLLKCSSPGLVFTKNHNFLRPVRLSSPDAVIIASTLSRPLETKRSSKGAIGQDGDGSIDKRDRSTNQNGVGEGEESYSRDHLHLMVSLHAKPPLVATVNMNYCFIPLDSWFLYTLRQICSACGFHDFPSFLYAYKCLRCMKINGHVLEL